MEIFYEKGKKYNCRVHDIPYYRKTATICGKRRSFYGDGEKDVNRKIEEAKQKERDGFNIDHKSARLGHTIKRWLFDVKRVDKNLKPTTFARYEGSFRIYIEPNPISNMLVSKLDSTALQAYINNMYEVDGVSGASIAGVVKVLRMFCKWALAEGFFVRNPCTSLVLPGKREKGKKDIEVFTNEERKKLFDYMTQSGYQYDALISLAFATGMRQGELLALQWGDIYDGVIHVERSTAMATHIDKEGNMSRTREIWDTKTKNSVRNIPLLSSTDKMLKALHLKQQRYLFSKGLPQTKYVFVTEEGKMIDPSSLRKSYSRLLARAKIPYRKFHAIRHTFATEAIRRGVDVKDLQKLMGHADIQTTYIYVQSDDRSRRAAIELMGEMMG